MKYIIFLILLISFPQSFADGVISVAKPVGEIITTSSSTCPSGSLSADGAPISRSNYANLFQAMGIAYGPGDGSTTFNVPDYRGRFLRSADESGIRNPSGALAVGTAQNQATAKNSLSLSDPGHNHIDGWAGVNSFSSFGVSPDVAGGNQNVQRNSVPTDHAFTSTSQANLYLSSSNSETRPMSIVVKYCVIY
jgi:microcystin-dependent protein